MDSSLKPQPLIAEVLPGFTVLAILTTSYFAHHLEQLKALISLPSAGTIITALGISVLLISWILGTILDTLRDLCEELLDRLWFRLDWTFLFDGPSEQIQKLENHWLAYYFLTGNYVIGLSITVVCGLALPPIRLSLPWLLAIIVVIVVLVIAFCLERKEIRGLINGRRVPCGLPHEGVYTRLVSTTPPPSKLYGEATEPCVGVRAIRDIKEGDYIFAPDDDQTMEVLKATVDDLPEPIKKLYYDMCVLEGDTFTCPTSFNKLTPSWYPNHSEDPNIEVDENLRFRARRNIRAGEELLSDYTRYSENEK